MYYFLSNLEKKTGIELVKAVMSIPNNTRDLFLNYNELGNLSDKELAEVIKSIPPTVTSLRLVGNKLGENANGLIGVLRALHDGVNTLDLGWNKLDNLSDKDLVEVIKSIPPTVTSLNLAGNELGKKANTLTLILRALHGGVNTLDLGWNELGNLSDKDLVEVIKSIPPTVTSLNLVGNELSNLSDDDLVKVMKSIPPSVTALYLGGNKLGKKADALTRVLNALHNGMTMLGLGFNELDKLPVEDLIKVIKSIPQSVISLGLYDNDFHKKSPDDLVKALAVIPASMKVYYGNDKLQKKYDIHRLLDSYLEDREKVIDSSGKTKEYFYGSFFSSFQKSFTQKGEAVEALKSALNGDDVDLSKHLSTLRNGQLGRELRAFVKSGMGNALVNGEVTTVSGFVQALQEQNAQKARPV